MIQATLKDILQGKIDTTHHQVYLVRDGDTVFYVGQSQDVRKRLRQHRNGSGGAFTVFLKANRDASPSWQVELYTIEELTTLIQDMRERENGRYYPLCVYRVDAPPTLDEAECALIVANSPCFNLEWNNTPSSVPDKYTMRLVVKSRYLCPYSLPEAFRHLFTIIRVPLEDHPVEASLSVQKPVQPIQRRLWR